MILVTDTGRIRNFMEIMIIEELEQIANEFCQNYCKWPDLWDEEKEMMELADSEHCRNCPINRLT